MVREGGSYCVCGQWKRRVMSIGWWVGPHASNCGVGGGQRSYCVSATRLLDCSNPDQCVQYAGSPNGMWCLLCSKCVTIVPDLFPM